MRLLGVELTRFRARRAVVIALLVAAGLAALMAASAVYSTRPPDATERATAEAAYQRELKAGGGSEFDACVESPTDFFGPGATVEDCEGTRPQLDWFLPRGQLHLANELEGRGTVLIVLLAGAAIVIAATFCGADWASGSMSNQLLFEPRRTMVWLGKAAAVVVGTTAVSALVIAGFWAALLLVAEARDLGPSSATVSDILTTSGRGLGLIAVVTLGSYALTMLLRHTVGTLGLLFAYAVVGEGLAASLPFERMSQWSMAQNVMAWLQDGVEIFDESVCSGFGECDATYTLSLEHAALYLGGLLVIAVVVSVLSFRVRDVP